VTSEDTDDATGPPLSLRIIQPQKPMVSEAIRRRVLQRHPCDPDGPARDHERKSGELIHSLSLPPPEPWMIVTCYVQSCEAWFTMMSTRLQWPDPGFQAVESDRCHPRRSPLSFRIRRLGHSFSRMHSFRRLSRPCTTVGILRSKMLHKVLLLSASLADQLVYTTDRVSYLHFPTGD
jgi:hypothetical protein